jgi:hypothetical protein
MVTYKALSLRLSSVIELVQNFGAFLIGDNYLLLIYYYNVGLAVKLYYMGIYLLKNKM